MTRTDQNRPGLQVGGQAHNSREIVSMILGSHHVAIPVRMVQDVLGPQRLTPVPLAAGEIAGLLNLRGRIVTAIDLRRRLGLPAADPAASMSVVVENEGELYSLVIDQVGEVLEPPEDRFETDLVTLTPAWREVARGIYRLDGMLLVLLDVARILSFGQAGVREDRAA